MNRCPIAFDAVLDANDLQRQVRAMYERVARAPASGFHFHTGADYAVQRLQYDAAELATLPETCVERFAGVGNPLRIGPIAPGAVVLDHACGAGMDLLLAARAVGPAGLAIGVDLTPGMRDYALRAAAQAGLLDRIALHEGTFEDLPVADGSVDYLISNGVLNLAPDKPRAAREIARVLRPGGVLYLADAVLDRPLDPRVRGDAGLWAACIGGALAEADLERLLVDAGLDEVRITERFECFAGTVLERKFHNRLHAYGVNLRAVKAPSAGVNRLPRPSLRDAPAGGTTMLKKYVIERDIAGIGAEPVEALCSIAQRSNQVLDELGTGVQWLHSYVVNDKTYCVYLARDEELIREHAKRAGFPADSIAEVQSVLDPTMAPG